jgi:hypothetical protein
VGGGGADVGVDVDVDKICRVVAEARGIANEL